jgi:probable HAF family extracellular repeat protein
VDSGFVTGAQGVGKRLVDGPVTGIDDAGATVGMTCGIAGCRGVVRGPHGHQAVILQPRRALFGGTATGLGARGKAAGWATLADGHAHAFMTVDRGADLHDLGTLTGTDSEAYAINANGRACGVWWDADHDNVERVFITDPGDSPRDVGIAGRCAGINDLEQLVGTASDHAFVTAPDGRDPRLIPLPKGARWAGLNAINRHGQAVGSELADGEDFPRAIVSDEATEHLFLLDTLVALPPGVSLQIGAAINDRGEIAADGSDGHVWLLEPLR